MRELPFFVMPMDALTHIAEELEIEVGEDTAAEIMRRYGEKSGMGIISRLGISSSREDLAENLPILWAESGLTSIKDVSVDGEDIIVELGDVPDVDRTAFAFIQGYLSGVVSLLLGESYTADEDVEHDGDTYVQIIRKGQDITTPTGQKKRAESVDSKDLPDIESGFSYLIVDEEPGRAYEMFRAIVGGREGMAITREFPMRIKKRYGLDDIPFIWLTYDTSVPFAREPGNVPIIYNDIKNFLLRNRGSVILLSGVEYLISQTSFERVLKFIQLANDKVAITDSILLVAMAPGTIPDMDFNMLKREMQVIN